MERKMMKENFRRKQYFSIRKYTKGACSVLLGTSLFLSLSYTGEAKATEEKEVCIHAVDNSSLSEQIRSQLKVFEENKIIVEEGKSYYFVYKKNNVLPSTGGLTSGTTVLGGALLLVCLTLIKKKKGKLIFLVSMLTVSGNLSQAMASSDFEEISPVVVKVVNGGMLPSPEEISGYSFTGYYFEIGKTCVNNSNSIKTEEREEFAPGLVEEKVGEEKKVVVSEKGDPLVQPEKPEAVISEKGEPLVQSEKPEGVVSEKGDPLVQPEKPEGVVREKGDPLVQEEKPEGVVREKGDPLVQPEKPEGVVSEKGDPLVQPEKPEGVVSEKGDPLVQPEKPEGVVREKGDPLVQSEKPEGVVREKGDPLVQPEKPEAVISEKGDPLVQEEKPEGVVREKGEPLVQSEKPEAVISEKGDPLVQEEKPEGVVSEKGDPLVQEEKPEGVVSEKGDPLVQEEKPEAVISEKGDPLVQPEKPLASWNGPTLVREENPIAEVSIKGDPLVQPENPEWKPTPEQPTPEVTPKPTKPVEEPKVYNTPIDIDDSDNPPPRPDRVGRKTRVKIPIDELKRSQTPEVIINGKPVIPLSTITTVKELDYKTIYKAGGPFLNFKEREEIEKGDKGVEVTTISYIRDESTGKTVEHISKKIVYQPIDRVIEVGNVKRVVEPIEITEVREDDPELPKGREVVIKGEQGERTKTITYEVNPETGELSNPTVKTEETRLARPRLILVGTKE